MQMRVPGASTTPHHTSLHTLTRCLTSPCLQVARTLLERYRNHHIVFNDDIQVRRCKRASKHVDSCAAWLSLVSCTRQQQRTITRCALLPN